MFHNHNHSHGKGSHTKAFFLGVTFNIIFVMVEIIYGFYADSMALIADAGHNFSDVLSLLLAWGASVLASRPATEKRTYGFRRVTILASLISSVLLLVALGGITLEAVERFSHSQSVKGNIIILVAGIGVIINTSTALLFVSGQKHDLNIRGAFLHMAADAGVSLGVVVSGLVIILTEWVWIDSVISLVIVFIILIGTWNLLKDSVNLTIDGVPHDVDIIGIKNYLTNLKTVCTIHDLHVWALSTTETALTVHLTTTLNTIDNNFLKEIQQHLHDSFNIEHATIQIENKDIESGCRLNRSECI